MCARERRTEGEPSVVKNVAIGLVNPRRSVARPHRNEPATMSGRRLPNRDVELSASIPGQLAISNLVK